MTSTPVSDTALIEDWPVFVNTVLTRLHQGKKAYGDGSFSLDPKELLEEVSQECLDQAGWSFICWRRIQKMLVAIKEVENAHKEEGNRNGYSKA